MTRTPVIKFRLGISQNISLANQVNENLHRDKQKFAQLYNLFVQTDESKWLDLFFIRLKMEHLAFAGNQEGILSTLPKIEIPEMDPQQRFDTFFDYYSSHENDFFIRNAILKIICEDGNIPSTTRASIVALHHNFHAEKKLTFGHYMERLREGDRSSATIQHAYEHTHSITEWEQLISFLELNNIFIARA